MQLSDNSENSKVVVLYVKDFKWLDQYTAEHFGGHLKNKRVYRAIYNKDIDSYRVLYTIEGRHNAVNLPSLITKSGAMYTSNIVLIDKQNIVDFDISEEDLDQIIKWDDHKDLKKIIDERRVVSQDQQEPEFIQELFKMVKQDELKEYMERSRELFQINPIMHDVLLDVITYLTGHTDMSIESLNLTMDDNFGPGINIGKTYEALGRYTSENKRVNFNPDDLLDGMEGLLTEYTRAAFD